MHCRLRFSFFALAAPLVSNGRRWLPLRLQEPRSGAAACFTSMRRVSSSIPGGETELPRSVLQFSLSSMGVDEFMDLFNSRPVAERAAAISVARRHPDGVLGLKVFVEELPRVSRDYIFQRGIRVEQWLRESALFRLLEDEVGGVWRVSLAVDAKWLLKDEAADDVTCEKKEKAPEATDDMTSMTEQLLQVLHDSVLGTREAGESNYKALNETYSLLLREASRNTTLRDFVNTLKYMEFLKMLNSPNGAKRFWVLHDKYICTRNVGETQPPRFVSPQPRVLVANALNAYGGWAAASNVPTRQDVYEILKYVPLNWGNFGNLNLPAAVKKKHIRISSTLQWFRRQPFYFELRNVSGTTEIRRSILLHPESHGLSPEEAYEQIQLKMASGEANSLVPLNAEGEVMTATDASQHAVALLKFITRVCPGYFVPSSLLMQRYTKKNLTHEELLACMKRHPDLFETIYLKYTDTPLLRRRIGADSARWKDSFVGDFERYPEDVRSLVILMGRVCSTWDRPHYVYVRLSEEEKMHVDGFEGMMQTLRRHPQVFRVGENFIARVDLADPLSLREPEPAPDDMTTRVPIREENPYQTPRDLAVVFHYAAPEDESCNAAFFVQCASPAMRAVLPPRIVSVLQLFPDLFVCKETSPGVFLMRKVILGKRRMTGDISSKERLEGGNGILPGAGGGCRSPAAVGEVAGEPLELETGFAESDFLTREEAVDAVSALIPPDGVDASQLLLWASIGIQQASNRYYGGVLRLVEANPARFRVRETPERKMILPAEPGGCEEPL